MTQPSTTRVAYLETGANAEAEEATMAMIAAKASLDIMIIY